MCMQNPDEIGIKHRFLIAHTSFFTTSETGLHAAIQAVGSPWCIHGDRRSGFRHGEKQCNI